MVIVLYIWGYWKYTKTSGRIIACVQLLFYIEIHFIPGSLVKVFSQSPSVMVIIHAYPGDSGKEYKTPLWDNTTEQ